MPLRGGYRPTERGGQAGELGLVGRVATSPVKPMPAIRVLAATSAQQLFDLREAEAVRLRHEDGELARLDRVGVERDVHRVGTCERTLDRPVSRMDAARVDELDLGRVEVARPDRARRASRRRRPSSSSMRSGIPHALPDGDVAGVFRSPCASIHTTARHSSPARERLDRANVGAAATTEHDRPVGQLGGEQQRLLGERVGLDHGRLWIRQLVERRLGHRLAARTPGPWNANEAGGKLAAARVALVLRPERDRGQRPAVWTTGAQARHGRPYP